MNTKNFFNKQEWPTGPWQQETDYQSWIDSDTLYACVARRNLTGAWCGFVGLDHFHPLYMVDISSSDLQRIEVHGTVTYADWNTTEDQEFYPSRRLWWIGFDAMHDDDLAPAFDDVGMKPTKRRRKSKSGTYRDLQFIESQIESLASQLAAADSRTFI